MPTYEYLCKSCGKRLEVQQKFTDDPLSECPYCEGPLRKVFGTVGIAFKGSGFYKTDSRGSSSKNGTAPVTSGESSTGDSSSSDANSPPTASPSSDTSPAKAPATSSSGTSST